jgi:hypothetical protein
MKEVKIKRKCINVQAGSEQQFSRIFSKKKYIKMLKILFYYDMSNFLQHFGLFLFSVYYNTLHCTEFFKQHRTVFFKNTEL